MVKIPPHEWSPYSASRVNSTLGKTVSCTHPRTENLVDELDEVICAGGDVLGLRERPTEVNSSFELARKRRQSVSG